MATTAIVFGPKGDIGRIVIQSLANRRIKTQGVTSLEFEKLMGSDTKLSNSQVFEIANGTDRVIFLNCMGKVRFGSYSIADIGQTLIANVLRPMQIIRFARSVGARTIHISSGELDMHKTEIERDVLSQLFTGKRWSDDSFSVKNCIDNLGRLSLSSEFDYYLFSKLLLEEICGEHDLDSYIRVSNFFGPDVKRLGQIPKLIEARIRGKHVKHINQMRNWCHTSELGGFIADIACEREIRKCYWGYGSFDLMTEQVFGEIEKLLPTCYGSVSLVSSHDNKVPIVPRIWEQSNTAALPANQFSGLLGETVRSIRRRISYAAKDCLAIDEEFKTAQKLGIAGGSIAIKKLIDEVVFEKRSEQTGYEGAARGKLTAEINFYRDLEKKKCKGIKSLFPNLISYNVDATSAALRIERIGSGTSVSDSILSGGPISQEEIFPAVSKLFQRSYCLSLDTLPVSHGLELLDALYLSRPYDRLLNLIKLSETFEIGSTLRRLLSWLANRDDFCINGAVVHNPLTIIEKIQGDENVARMFSPKCLGPCGHGDLTILNMLLRDDNRTIVFIDPRGQVGDWDPIYDIGKLAFSLSGFAEILNGNLTVADEQDNIALPLRQRNIVLQEARRSLFRWIHADPCFFDLRQIEADHLEMRIELAEAAHYLSDGAYRFLQGKDSIRASAVLTLGAVKLHDVYMYIHNRPETY